MASDLQPGTRWTVQWKATATPQWIDTDEAIRSVTGITSYNFYYEADSGAQGWNYYLEIKGGALNKYGVLTNYTIFQVPDLVITSTLPSPVVKITPPSKELNVIILVLIVF